MKAKLDEQLQSILGTDELIIITERVDDIALLIGQMMKMGLPEVLDKHIPSHWKLRYVKLGLDNGYLVSLHFERRRS